MAPPDKQLTEEELIRLYEYVEAGYREPSTVGRLRKAVTTMLDNLRPDKVARGPVERERAVDPLAAVYLRGTPDFFVPVSTFRNYTLFGFGSKGFDAWQETARQLAAEPDTPVGDTVLARFSKAFRPETAAERLFSSPRADVPESSPLWDIKTLEFRPFWPWSPEVRPWPAQVPADLRLANHGPLGDRILQLEVWRLKRLVASLKADGYRPPPTDTIRGVFLMLGNETRFIIWGGFHRVAALAALGHDEIPVQLAGGLHRLMSLDQLHTWPLVRQGVFSPDLADLLVERLFSEDGSEMAARLGLGPRR